MLFVLGLKSKASHSIQGLYSLNWDPLTNSVSVAHGLNDLIIIALNTLYTYIYLYILVYILFFIFKTVSIHQTNGSLVTFSLP